MSIMFKPVLSVTSLPVSTFNSNPYKTLGLNLNERSEKSAALLEVR